MRKRTRLKVLRVAADLTQLQLARLAGMNATRYWQIENGEGPEVTKDEREAVAAPLGVTVASVDWPHDHLKAASA